MNRCNKVPYATSAQAQAAADAITSVNLHAYLCHECWFTWHIGHKKAKGGANPETKRRMRRHRRQREALQFARWDDDGGAINADNRYSEV